LRFYRVSRNYRGRGRYKTPSTAEIPKNPFYHPGVIGFFLAFWELPELGEDKGYFGGSTTKIPLLPSLTGDSQRPFILIKEVYKM
jgi:hypothetical protein